MSTFDEHARRVVRDPVARGVVDGVAGRAAEAEQLAPWAAPSRRWRRCSGCRTGRSGWRPSSRGAGRDHTHVEHRAERDSSPRRPSASVDADGHRRWRRAAPRRRSSAGRARRSPGPAGRRSSGWCRSGWPGSRRRRGSLGAGDDADLGAGRRSLALIGVTAPHRRPGSRPRRRSRYRASNAAHASAVVGRARRTRFWNASSRS